MIGGNKKAVPKKVQWNIAPNGKITLASNAGIEWTTRTWNPITGCSKISAGCKFCYAEKIAIALQKDGEKKYQNGFNVTAHQYAFNDPYRWIKPELVFVNSMSDFFHENLTNETIFDLFEIMNENQQHIFQILTKRPDRIIQMNSKLKWTSNIWMGTSVEDERVLHRVDDLRKIGAHVKFLSCEPLIGPLKSINMDGIHWLIVGGESGDTPRPMQKEWVADLQQQCEKADIPFFFKQWGGKYKKAAGRELNGRTYDEMPEAFKKWCIDYHS